MEKLWDKSVFLIQWDPFIRILRTYSLKVLKKTKNHLAPVCGTLVCHKEAYILYPLLTVFLLHAVICPHSLTDLPAPAKVHSNNASPRLRGRGRVQNTVNTSSISFTKIGSK